MATTNVTPVDFDSPEIAALSLDEIIKRAQEEADKATEVVTQPVVDKKEEVADPPAEKVEDKPEPKVFYAQKSFDLGDGAGSQVFKGKGATREEALEDLSDKLIESQRNATKRIKELKTAKPEAPTKEEESLLAAEIVTNPSKVVKNILGIDPSDLKQVVEEAKQNRALKQRKVVADQFVASHPEFYDNERNGQRLAKAVSLHGEFNLENLEKAYQDLSESGLLEVKGEEAGGGQDKDKQVNRTDPTVDANPPQRTRKASGVSTHSKTVVPAKTEPTEDELYSMPLDELRKRANKHLAGQ